MGKMKPSHDVGQTDKAVLLQCMYPFGIIGDRRIDAAVALGGAGDALVGKDDAAGGIACVAHCPVRDGLVRYVDGGVVHVEGQENAFADKGWIRLMRDAFDDQRQQTETGIAVAEPAARRKIGGIVRAQETEDIRVEHLGRLAGGDE
jgi:hypothetical protein